MPFKTATLHGSRLGAFSNWDCHSQLPSQLADELGCGCTVCSEKKNQEKKQVALVLLR
jgi:hypothetical protein